MKSFTFTSICALVTVARVQAMRAGDDTWHAALHAEAAQSSQMQDVKALNAIGDAVKSVFRTSISRGEQQAALERMYVALHLDKAHKHAGVLNTSLEETFPGLLQPYNAKKFINKIVSCGNDNTFLRNAMKAVMANSTVQEFFQSRDDAPKVLSEAVGLAVLFDRLTNLVVKDFRRLQWLRVFFTEERGDSLKYLNTFEVAKTVSVDLATSQYTRAFREGSVPKTKGRFTLPMNILEAMLEDQRLGHKANAEAGSILAFHGAPGSATMIPETGAGPTTLANKELGDLVEYRCPLPLEYANLYSTWNLAFVSHYPNAPYFWAKLINPAVFCYKGAPEHYMYKRVVSLYLFIQFYLFQAADNATKPTWNSEEMVDVWSQVNLESAEGYFEMIKQKQPGLVKRAALASMDFGAGIADTLTESWTLAHDLFSKSDEELDTLDKWSFIQRIGGTGSVLTKKFFSWFLASDESGEDPPLDADGSSSSDAEDGESEEDGISED